MKETICASPLLRNNWQANQLCAAPSFGRRNANRVKCHSSATTTAAQTPALPGCWLSLPLVHAPQQCCLPHSQLGRTSAHHGCTAHSQGFDTCHHLGHAQPEATLAVQAKRQPGLSSVGSQHPSIVVPLLLGSQSQDPAPGKVAKIAPGRVPPAATASLGQTAGARSR